jgi:hypothetical protein
VSTIKDVGIEVLLGKCCPDCKEFTYREGAYRCAIDNSIVSDYAGVGIATGVPYLDKDMLFKIWKIMIKKENKVINFLKIFFSKI